jgi:hypothetical protein
LSGFVIFEDGYIIYDVDHLIQVAVGLVHIELVEGIDAGSRQGVETTSEGVHGTTIGNH